MSKSFELTFSGETIPGADIQKVRNNAAKLFRAGPAQLEKLFSGATVVLKNQLTEETAESYQKKLKAAGMICAYREMNREAAVTATPKEAEVKEVAAEAPDDSWSIAPTGSDVNPHEKQPEPPMPDTSQFSLKEQQGYLFEQDDTPPPPAPDTSHLTLD